MNNSKQITLSEFLLRPMMNINKRALKKLSKSILIKMLLTPIVKIDLLESFKLLEHLISFFDENDTYNKLNEHTKSEIIRLILNKEKKMPEIKINHEDMTYGVEEHIPNYYKITYSLELSHIPIPIPDSNFEFVCNEYITACQ